jgi:hypothetical protein
VSRSVRQLTVLELVDRVEDGLVATLLRRKIALSRTVQAVDDAGVRVPAVRYIATLVIGKLKVEACMRIAAVAVMVDGLYAPYKRNRPVADAVPGRLHDI